MPTVQDRPVRADRTAERGERGLRDHPVCVGGQRQDGNSPVPKIRQLDPEVGGTRHAAGSDQAHRVAHDVVDQVVAHGQQHVEALSVGHHLPRESHSPKPDRPVGGSTHGVEQDEISDPLRIGVRQFGGYAAAEGVADDDRGRPDSNHGQELVHPSRVPVQGHLFFGQVRRAAQLHDASDHQRMLVGLRVVVIAVGQDVRDR